MSESSWRRSSPEQTPRRVVTLPNVLSLLRFASIPVFLWLLLARQEDGWGLAVLVVSALTDWLDGKLARWLHQESRLGQLLDPFVDRLYLVAVLVAFLFRDIVPWWLVAPLLLREFIVGICLLALRRQGFAPLEVTYVGKAATFTLMYALPLLLLATLLANNSRVGELIVHPVAYAFTIWGCGLYLWSGALYVIQTVRAVGVRLAR